MKKLLIIALIGITTLGFVACGTSEDSNQQNATTDIVQEDQETKKNDTKKEVFKLDKEKFIADNQITLNAIDVEYDMSNNVDKSFLIEGKASLDDYYNYEYSDEIKDMFSVSIDPPSGDAGKSWHVYFDREEFNELYEVLKKGDQNILVKAINPSDKNKESMGNLATGEVAVYDTSVLSQKDNTSKTLTDFMAANSVEKKAIDVEYDIANNLDTSFAIEGEAELGDYFNYNFRDKEKEYFNVNLYSKDGKTTSHWNLYFNREEFKDLFEELKLGKKNIDVKAVMPANLYEDGMNNMAVGESVQINKYYNSAKMLE